MSLRHGFTTGTAAAAAAAAAAMRLVRDESPGQVEVPLPVEGRYKVAVARIVQENGGIRAVVIKDAGDDPDATHGAEVHALVRLAPGGGIKVRGGRGVGVVTLPGLPVAVGEAAINPDPRRQIEAAVAEVLAGSGQGAEVVIEVPEGERLALKTMNPRLGIVGGISILGTRGTVVPFSHEAWQASIVQAMNVAVAQGLEELVVATGRRSAGWAARDTGLDKLAVVEMADFFAFSLRAAAARNFRRVFVACLFGKLIKQALGFENTHAQRGELDFRRLAGICRRAGLQEGEAARIETANTGRAVLELLAGHPARQAVLGALAGAAGKAARGFLGPGEDLIYHVYDYEGDLLLKAPVNGDMP